MSIDAAVMKNGKCAFNDIFTNSDKNNPHSLQNVLLTVEVSTIDENGLPTKAEQQWGRGPDACGQLLFTADDDISKICDAEKFSIDATFKIIKRNEESPIRVM